jgi:hypothetical protein
MCSWTARSLSWFRNNPSLLIIFDFQFSDFQFSWSCLIFPVTRIFVEAFRPVRTNPYFPEWELGAYLLKFLMLFVWTNESDSQVQNSAKTSPCIKLDVLFVQPQGLSVGLCEWQLSNNDFALEFFIFFLRNFYWKPSLNNLTAILVFPPTPFQFHPKLCKHCTPYLGKVD